MCSATILEASDGEPAFLLSATGVCQVRPTRSNHNPLVLVIKWGNASFILMWVQSKVKTWPKNHYHSCNSEMPKAWAGIRTEVSSLSASQTVHGMIGISFFYSVSFFWIHSFHTHMDKLMKWKGNSHWLKCLFSVKSHYLLFSRQTPMERRAVTAFDAPEHL